MRFVPVKGQGGQAIAMAHRARDLLIKNRTMLVNALRGHLAEFGHFSGALPHVALLERTVAAKGLAKLPDLIKIVSLAPKAALPDMVRATLSGFLDAILLIGEELAAIERRLMAWHKTDAQSQRLATAPGIGLIGATALSALVPDAKLFKACPRGGGERPPSRRLAWACAQARGHRRQDKPRAHLEGGRPLSPPPFGAWGHLADPLFAKQTTPLALWVQGLLAERSSSAACGSAPLKSARNGL
jgi:hypothetical protein